MRAEPIYRILEHPRIYQAIQDLLAPGAEAGLTNLIREAVRDLPRAPRIVDIGCGPRSRLWSVGLEPIGLDLSIAYASNYAKRGTRSIVASAASLPLETESVDGLWSIGLLHHLPDLDARSAVDEMVRATRVGGYVAIFDGVMPRSAWRRPHIWLQRRVDRGRFMRYQSHLEGLLPSERRWRARRISYSRLGHEGVLCTMVKA